MSDNLVKQLRVFAQGLRRSMWQSRDRSIELMDAAADRIEELEAKLAKAVEATCKALDSIDQLNTLPPDENGHYWRESDLLDQEVMSLRTTLAELSSTIKERDNDAG